MATRKPKIQPTEPLQVPSTEPKGSSLHLWTLTDVAHWRDRLSKEQKGIDPITGEPFYGRVCLDHDHSKTGESAQRVRGALGAATNAAEGRIKAIYHRYLKYMTDQPLHVILRNLSDYYQKDNSHLPLHPSWIKTVQSTFSTLPEPAKAKVLKELGKENGANASSRKKIFLDCIKSKKFSYTYLMDLISKSKV
jgi:hypothetical protein